MRKADICVLGVYAGVLIEHDDKTYEFCYSETYEGLPVSLTMPVSQQVYRFDEFPAFFDGLLPEGVQLEALLRQNKIDKRDFFSQLISVGRDVVGAVTVAQSNDTIDRNEA